MLVHLQLRYHDSSKHTHTNYKKLTELCWGPEGLPEILDVIFISVHLNFESSFLNVKLISNEIM